MTKEEQVIQYIQEYIQTRKLREGDKIPSEYELARRCGVNKTTANKAVAHLVQRGIIERRGGAAGSVLASPVRFHGTIVYRTNLISGLTYGARLVRGAQNAAMENGYALQYMENNGDDTRQFAMIRSSGARGLLITGTNPPEPSFPMPFVCVEHGPSDIGNHVYSNRLKGAGELLRFVYKRGHRNPLLIAHHEKDEFVEGVFRESAALGCPLSRDHLFSIGSTLEFNPSRVYQSMRRQFPDFTVIMCMSDNIAMRLLLYLEEQRISVPEQLSITGFGSMAEYQRLRPITTMNQFPEDIGYTACKGLVDILEGRRENIREDIDTQLQKGDTLATLSKDASE